MSKHSKTKNTHFNPNQPPTVFYIGIDCGVKTGLAIWNSEEQDFTVLTTVKIHHAMDAVKKVHEDQPGEAKVFIEDPRFVRFKTDAVKAQGAGSVKRDAKIWEDFCEDIGVPYELVRPNKRFTKFSSETFSKITGHKGGTSVHARDAGMLVFGRK